MTEQILLKEAEIREQAQKYEEKLQQAHDAANDKIESLKKSHDKEVKGLNSKIKELEEKLANAGGTGDDDFDRYAF